MMQIFFLTLLTGVIFGIIDILPMIKMKLDKSAIISAFIFYLIMPFIIYNTNLFEGLWWLKGGAITLLLSLPIIALVAKEGISSAFSIAAMSIILGTLIGFVDRFVFNSI